jgi:hypothetical protein
MEFALGPELLPQALRTDVAVDDDRKSGAKRIAFRERVAQSGKLRVECRDDFAHGASRDFERFGAAGPRT